MTYLRVIPRDLFNEANLLKCYGRLWISLNVGGIDAKIEHDGKAFDICQHEASGGLYISNIRLIVRGFEYYLERPLNSRTEWPLYMETEDDVIAVFNDYGSFSDKMNEFIGVK